MYIVIFFFLKLSDKGKSMYFPNSNWNELHNWKADGIDKLLIDAVRKCENDVLCILNGTKIKLIIGEILIDS